MNKFKLNIVKMRKYSSLKLKFKLYILILKKKFKIMNLFSINSLKFIIPSLVLWLSMFWIFSWQETNISKELVFTNKVKLSIIVKDIANEKRQKLAKVLEEKNKYEIYKTYAMVRVNNLKIKK